MGSLRYDTFVACFDIDNTSAIFIVYDRLDPDIDLIDWTIDIVLSRDTVRLYENRESVLPLLDLKCHAQSLRPVSTAVPYSRMTDLLGKE